MWFGVNVGSDRVQNSWKQNNSNLIFWPLPNVKILFEPYSESTFPADFEKKYENSFYKENVVK